MAKKISDDDNVAELLDAILQKYLGRLEAEAMRSLWRLNSATAREVLSDLRYRRRPAYTTVNTILWRLSEKGLVHRSLDGRSYRYSAAAGPEEFLRGLSGRLVGTLLRDFGPVAVASFVEEIDKDSPEKRTLLDKLLGRKTTL